MSTAGNIDANLTQWSKNITRLSYSNYFIQLDRRLSHNEIRNMKLDMMPGFRFTWNYNKHMQPEAKYRNDVVTKEFVKYEKLLIL